MLYVFINKAVDDLNSLNKRSLNVLSHSPPSPSESLGIINSGNSPEYAHFNNKLTINDFDLLKVKFAISTFVTMSFIQSELIRRFLEKVASAK